MLSAVVLAAGEGTGAWPFSGVRQKVTVPVANTPLVRRLVSQLLEAGVGEAVVVVGHRAEAVRACLGGLEKVSFVAQSPLRGPVDAALTGLDAVHGEDVLLCAGDTVLTQHDVTGLVRSYRDSRAPVVLTTPHRAGIPRWTAVVSDGHGRVQHVRGQESEDAPCYGGLGIAPVSIMKQYMLRNPGVMDNLGVGAMPPAEGDAAYTFDLMARDGIEVAALPAGDFVIDVDRPWDIVEANQQAVRRQFESLDRTVISEGASIDDGADIPSDAKLFLGPGAHIGRGCHIEGPVWLGAGSRIVNGAIIGPGVTIGADSVCRNYCYVDGGAVMGNKCVVSHGAEFTGVIFNTVYLYHYCCITGLLGDNVDIGAATVCGTLRFDNGTRTQVVDGHREVPAAHGSYTYMGDYSRSGVNVMFMPGVKVGSYSCVGAGAIVYEDVPANTLVLPKQELVRKEWGPRKYGW